MVLLQQGELAAARKTEEEALRMATDIKLKLGGAQALFQLGEIALMAGDLPAARRHHDDAMAARREMKETRTIAESELALAAIALEEGQAAEAERQAAAVLSRGQGPAPLRAAGELLIARARLANRDLPGAARALASARQLSRHSERVSVRNGLAMVQAEIDAGQGRTREAREGLAVLQRTLSRSGMVLGELERRLLLLRIDRADGRAAVRGEARTLEKDAGSRGLGLIVRRAQSL
jgi:ATP/maltotriose-dependent transcriptional regulator MalT